MLIVVIVWRRASRVPLDVVQANLAAQQRQHAIDSTRPKRPGFGTGVLMVLAFATATAPSTLDRAMPLLALNVASARSPADAARFVRTMLPSAEMQAADQLIHLGATVLFVWLIFRVVRLRGK
jgi:hypothetical protein